MIPGFGEARQAKLEAARVAVAGLGGLGSPVSIYLAAAGVGHLTLIDNQRVERSNLNRQVLHWEPDLGQLKVKSAAEKLKLLNSSVKLTSFPEEITDRNIRRLIRGADVVVDALDNYPTRYLLNEACVGENIPFVHGAVEGLVGQVLTVLPRKGPCLKCAVPREPPKRPMFPVLGATAGVIGCLQAMEAVKLIAGVGKPLVGRMLIFSGTDMTFDEIRVKRDPNCRVCGR